MANQQRMQRRIEKTEDLQSVVGTMKSLAAVSIRQYEQAAESLDEFNRTVELGLRVVLKRFPFLNPGEGPATGVRRAIVFGSDQGMCGKFNEDVFERFRHSLAEEERGQWEVIAVGQRVQSLVEQTRWPVVRGLTVPGSRDAITRTVQDLLTVLGDTEGLAAVRVFHNRHASGASYEPASVRLLPLDREWLAFFRAADWPTNQLPAFTVDRNRLFAFLVRQYLFVSLYRAAAHSLAGENASRLASMQAAEKNIEEQLGELTAAYHRQRQSAITEELLDIVSGFEALSE